MCGLLFTNISSVDKASFLSGLRLMQHRGPDVINCYHEIENNKFGHNRLKIIDLDDRSNQPMFSQNKRYIMLYNGEVYNSNELKKKYAINTATTSDSEVILELYSKIGSDFLNEINGMFAIVIYDTVSKKIFIARDRLGIKPLYYLKKGKQLIIASEISSILELSNTYKLDSDGIRQYKKLRSFFNGRTLYSDIKMFPAAHYQYGANLIRYWDLPYETDRTPPSDEELLELIQSAVDYRCISDVPVGSYLSGGIDSSIITALANESHSWTVGFSDSNEFEWARIAANNFNTIHHEVNIDYDEFCEITKEMVLQRKEPLSVPNEVLLYKMTKDVKLENTVVLSGEGADELFFGYDRIFSWASNNKWSIEEFDKYYSYGSSLDFDIVQDALSPFIEHHKSIDIVANFFSDSASARSTSKA